MGASSRGSSHGRGKVGVPAIRRLRAQIHGRKVGGGGGSTGKVRGGGSRKLGAHGDQIEQGEDWIVVSGRRIGRGGLRVNDQGQVYVPDSEEEEADMEMEDEVSEGAAAVMVPATRSPAAVVAKDVGPAVVVAADGAPAMDVPDEAIEVAANGYPGMELAPEVQARLEAVLAGMDPLYHDVFISLYKIMAAH